MQVRYVPQYEGQTLKDVTIEVRERAIATLDEAARPVRQLSYIEQDGQKFVAGIVADDELRYWWTDGEAVEHRAQLRVDAPEHITHVRVGRNGSLLAGTDKGRVYHWELTPEPQLTDISPVSTTPITALEWMLGGNSWVAATEDGGLSGWLRAPTADGTGTVMAQAHTFAPQASPVVGLSLSGRERSFATAGRDGTIVLRHLTSERVRATLPASGPVRAGLITPEAEGLRTVS